MFGWLQLVGVLILSMGVLILQRLMGVLNSVLQLMGVLILQCARAEHVKWVNTGTRLSFCSLLNTSLDVPVPNK